MHTLQTSIASRLAALAELKNDIVSEGEVSRDVSSLEQQVVEMEERQQAAEQELLRINGEICNIRQLSEAKEAQIAALEKQVGEYGTDANRSAAERDERLESAKCKNRASETACANMCDAAGKAEQQLSAKEDEAKNTLRLFEKQQESYEQQLAAVQDERRAASTAADAASVDAAQLKAWISSAQQRLDCGTKELAEQRQSAEEIKSTANLTETELSTKQTQLIEVQQMAESRSSKQAVNQSQLEVLRVKKAALVQRVSDAKKASALMESQNETLQAGNSKMTAANAELKRKFDEDTEAVAAASSDSEGVIASHTEVRAKLKTIQERLVALKAQREEYECKHSALSEQEKQLETEVASLSAKTAAHSIEMPKMLAKVSDLEATTQKLREKTDASAQQQMEVLCANEREVADLQGKYSVLYESTGETRDRMKALRQMTIDQDSSIETLQEQEIAHESLRRKLHNEMCELKGNIRVFCRVRPTKAEEAANGGEAIRLQSPTSEKECLSLVAPTGRQNIDPSKEGREQSYDFGFDKVFGGPTSQEHVFEEVSTLIQSALDGYKVCLFAYGQTGSGKTHTMQGGETPGSEGIIPRAIVRILETAEALQKQGWKYTVTASFMEIYNESIRDLLGSAAAAAAASRVKQAWSETKEATVEYTIKHDVHGNTHVSNMTEVPICSLNQVEELMEQASHNRSVGVTAMNSRSSRSHSVFTLRLRGENASQGTVLNGVLNLIDLAGSERLAQSKAAGSRLKETQAINKSLSSLGDVSHGLQLQSL